MPRGPVKDREREVATYNPPSVVINRRVRRVGNSLMVSLPPEIAREAGFSQGMEVRLTSRPGRVEIAGTEVPGRDLVEFAAKFTDRYRQALEMLAEV
jgi:antitoxin component of MazEF toxin-antitoxin module